jgi:uncharacterized hydrophobic protein (TIGR00341 family)
MRVIEVVADAGHLDTIQALAEEQGVMDVWWGPESDDGRRAVRMLVSPEHRQTVLDRLQGLLSGSTGAHILVEPLEAVLPRPETSAEESRRTTGLSREELYEDIAKGTRVDGNFLLLVWLSTLVAAIGMIENNVAVVIGAMVIAPLLGPNLALALATALGDLDLMWQAIKANLTGVGLALATSIAIGWMWPEFLTAPELHARTQVGLGSVALALASGAAAVLSLTTGVSTVLVGVMVAVALLPPTAAMGLFLGAGQIQLALGAALLTAVNVVSVNLAAKLVFLIRGVKPRTWLDKRKARQSLTLYIALWLVTLAVLMVVIYLRPPDTLTP